MKRIFALLIALIFIATLFTACTETTVTPTNTVTNTTVTVEKQEVDSVVDVMEDVDSSMPQTAEDQPEQKDAPVENTVSKIQAPSPAPVSSQTEPQQEPGTSDGNQTNGVPPEPKNVYFSSIAALENWFKNGNQVDSLQGYIRGNKVDSLRAEIMGNAQLNSPLTTTTYYLPKSRSGNERLKLAYIGVFSEEMYVAYDTPPENQSNYVTFTIPIKADHNLKILESLRKIEDERMEHGVIKAANGMEYEYFHNPYTGDVMSLFWEQDGLVFEAGISDYSEGVNPVDEILPYLQVEKVKLQANDHVTQ